jgi:hypothetical protein
VPVTLDPAKELADPKSLDRGGPAYHGARGEKTTYKTIKTARFVGFDGTSSDDPPDATARRAERSAGDF